MPSMHFDQIVGYIIFALLVFLAIATPVASLDTVATIDGRQLIGTAQLDELRVTTDTGVVVLPRVSLDEIRRQGDTLTVTTKDNRTITGQLELEELLLATDLQTHALTSDQLQEVDFDAFVNVEALPEGRHLSCPIRLTLPAVSLLLSGGGHSTRPNQVRCGESYILSLEISTSKAKGTNRKGERVRGHNITVRPYVVFGEGHDYQASLEIALLDGDHVLGGDIYGKVFDEGKSARPGPYRFWVADEAIEGATDLKFRLQFLMVNENEDRGRGSDWWWFTQRGSW
jgi:hypothetical protein